MSGDFGLLPDRRAGPSADDRRAHDAGGGGRHSEAPRIVTARPVSDPEFEP